MSVPVVQKHIYEEMHIHTIFLCACVYVCVRVCALSGAGGSDSVEPKRQPK